MWQAFEYFLAKISARRRAGALVFCLGLLLFCTTLTGEARARGVHELNYFQTSEVEVQGRQATRVEIGLDRDNLTYTAAVPQTEPDTLQLTLQKTRRGKVQADIPVQSKEIRSVQFTEAASRSLVVRIKTTHQTLQTGDYQVQLALADRKKRLPYRLVLDVFHPAAAAVGAVEGVRGHTIVLDAGHGGSDSGAVGPAGITEASVTLPVTQAVRDILQASGARVVMTRDTDVDVYGPNASDREELQARVNVGARTPGAELFVSIHCNAFSSPSAHGMETYYYPKTDADYRLASLLNEELAAAGGRFNRGVKEARFYVMRNSAMPASLVELAFITNPAEERLLADAAYQQRLAAAIARGIARYFRERLF